VTETLFTLRYVQTGTGGFACVDDHELFEHARFQAKAEVVSLFGVAT
jgi:hypothetical protein